MWETNKEFLLRYIFSVVFWGREDFRLMIYLLDIDLHNVDNTFLTSNPFCFLFFSYGLSWAFTESSDINVFSVIMLRLP